METESSSLSPVLPDDLILQILPLLPVKSLLRFRCVSKSWKSLIYNPSFAKLHLQNSPKHTNILFTVYNPLEYYTNVFAAVTCSITSLLENPSLIISEHGSGSCPLDTYFRVLGSCNGLVCLFSSFIEKYKFAYYRFLFWNPATRLTSKVSLSLLLRMPLPAATFGFGYDSSSDTYKVVAVLLGRDESSLKIRSIGDNGWRNILSWHNHSFPIIDKSVDGQFLNGTLNWLAFHKSDYDHELDRFTMNRIVIVSLDLATETFKQMLLPDGLDEGTPDDDKAYGELGVLRNSLCFINNYIRTCFVLWQMKEFGVEKSWTQLLKIQIHGDPLLLSPLCICEDGDVVMLANNTHFEAILYNIRDNSEKRSAIPYRHCYGVKDYVQSLILPC